MTNGRWSSDRGSMSVELVAVVPLLVLVTVVCVQGFTAVSAIEATARAARDAARAAALGQDASAAARRALPSGVGVDSITVTRGGGCPVPGAVCADVRVRIPVGYPGILAADGLSVHRQAVLPFPDAARAASGAVAAAPGGRSG
ncbi:MAG: TadE/TadG family type IV pilus assembly protein [Angustibacter sp.]